MIGIDLGDEKQAIAVADHDGRVLARKTVRVKAFRLGEALGWAVTQAAVKGFAEVTVACEPTGPRWLQVQRLCAERGLPLVCIQPLVSHIARQQQDYTTHKTDEADCVLIARLAAELHCYVPEELDEAWAHLRHLGRRRAQLITAATASVLGSGLLVGGLAGGAGGVQGAVRFGDLAGRSAGGDGPVRRGPGQARCHGAGGVHRLVRSAVPAGAGSGRTGGCAGVCSRR